MVRILMVLAVIGVVAAMLVVIVVVARVIIDGTAELKSDNAKLPAPKVNRTPPKPPSPAEQIQHLPIIQNANRLLDTIQPMYSLNLSSEEKHNLEVLKEETKNLIATVRDTPEAIRQRTDVSQAWEDQLLQIMEGVHTIQLSGATSIVRDANNGAAFLKLKFNTSPKDSSQEQ